MANLESDATHSSTEPTSSPDAGSSRGIRGTPRGLRNQNRAVVFLLYLLAASVVLTVFAVRPGFEGNPRATFTDQVEGRSYRPFAGRILVPTLIRGVCSATPDEFERSVAQRLEHRRFVRTLGWNSERIYEYLAAMALMAGCFVGTLYVWRALIARFYRYPAHVASLAPIIGLLSLTLLFRYLSYVYDPATLLLFSAGILALGVRDRGWFVVVLTLAALNKETSALLVPLYLLRYRGELAPRRLVVRVGGLSVLWLAVRAFAAYVVRRNPGQTLEFHLIDHNVQLFRVHPFSLAYSVLIFALAVWLVRREWESKPGFLRAGLLITFVPLFAAALFFGYVDELRGYYEAFPFAFLLSVPSLCSILGIAETDSSSA